MKTMYYFHTAGKTEYGGLDLFLKQINPGIYWDRQFPTRQRGAGKPKRSNEPPSERKMVESGTTADELIQAMLDRIREHPETYLHDHCAGILLEDDADCRFSNLKELEEERDNIALKIQEILGQEVPFYFLVASPEVEAWLLADWNESFKSYYHSVYRRLGVNPFGFENRLKTYLTENVLKGFEEQIELYGQPPKNNNGIISCSIKLSDQIIAAFATVAGSYVETHEAVIQDDGFRYKKDRDGKIMLGDIRPSQVADVCRIFFAPVYRKITAIN